MAGALDWYSTELEETQDRDLVLAGPLTIDDGKGDGEYEVEAGTSLILSARSIRRLYVTWVEPMAQS